jgi:hypothetical protein
MLPHCMKCRRANIKTLFLDIETSPNTAFVWNLFKENIPLARLIETSQMLCYSAKWAGDSGIIFDSLFKSGAKNMLAGIHELLDQADAVVHYNGQKFDIPVLNKEFIIEGFTPPAPYKNIDLYRTVRNVFKFTSNKLDHVVQQLGLGEKIPTTFDLWVACMNNDAEAWKFMEQYNKNDVVILEKLYQKLLPWIPNHPNYTLYTDSEAILCPTCGGSSYIRRGFAYTTVGKYQRFQCSTCGKWFKDRKNLTYKQTVTA